MYSRSTIVVAFLVLLASLRIYTIKRAAFNSLTNVPFFFPAEFAGTGKCSVVRNETAPAEFKFCEDARLWKVGKDTKIILSCDPSRHGWNTVMGPMKDPKPRGNLWMYHPGPNSYVEPIIIKGFSPRAYFHPVGFDIWTEPGADHSEVYVVNHGKQVSTIEHFRLSHDLKPLATYVRTITSLFFRSPNGLALTSANSFYLTHDHFFTRRLPFPMGNIMPIVETFFALPLGWINHVRITPEGKPKLSLSVFGMAFPNGVAISHDGKEVAIASTNMGLVHLYSRDPETNKLTYKSPLEVPFSPDNLYYDRNGGLTVAGHPHFLAIRRVATNKTGATAPSWVIRFTPKALPDVSVGSSDEQMPVMIQTRAGPHEDYVAHTLYQSDGSVFQTSSTGVFDVDSGSPLRFWTICRGIAGVPVLEAASCEL